MTGVEGAAFRVYFKGFPGSLDGWIRKREESEITLKFLKLFLHFFVGGAVQLEGWGKWRE